MADYIYNQGVGNNTKDGSPIYYKVCGDITSSDYKNKKRSKRFTEKRDRFERFFFIYRSDQKQNVKEANSENVLS